MSRSDETLFRQWLMLTKIPRYPRKISVPDLKNILRGEGYTVDTRTVQRDLNKLSISFPLNNDTEGRKNYWYWIKDAIIQDLPGMDPVTALAFDMAQSFLTPLLPHATLAVLQPYFDRAHEVLNSQSDSLLRKWSDKVTVIERGPTLLKPTIKPEVQQAIYHALLEEKVIQATYKTRNNDKDKNFTIHPLGIVSRIGVIYLICTMWEYSDVRYLALHRFTSAEVINTAQNINPDFSMQNYIENEQQFSIPQQKQPILLKVLFDSRTADHLAETPLTDKQKLTPQTDHKVLLEAEVIDSLDLRWWLQGFGNNVEVLQPDALRQDFIRLAQNLGAIYL